MADKKYTIVQTGDDDKDPENYAMVPTEAALMDAAKVKQPRQTKKRK